MPYCFVMFCIYFRPSSAAFECLRAFVLHLLDTEWKVCGIPVIARAFVVSLRCSSTS